MVTTSPPKNTHFVTFQESCKGQVMTGQLEVLTQLAVLLERVLLEWLVDLPPFCRYPPPGNTGLLL